MKKVLFVCTYGDFLVSFELSNINIYLSMGYEVHCAANFFENRYNRKTEALKKLGLVIHNVPFVRKPWNLKIFGNVRLLNKIVKDNKIDVIDVHNAVCGVIARHVGAKCKVKKIIYTPHSFFFYKGCPNKNSIIFKSVEKHYAKKTDLLVTINKEDYEAASKMKVRGKVIYVPGIGINVNKIANYIVNKASFIEEFGIKENEKVFVSIGELIARKNHILAINALSKIENKNFKYIICGFGEEDKTLREVCKERGIDKNVIFAGYREDVYNILHNSDFFLFPSKQEGLPVALMEAMASKTLCIVSDIRGNVDLIENEISGYVFDHDDVNEFTKSINNALNLKDEDKQSMINQAYNKVLKCDVSNVSKLMTTEYADLLD